MLNCRLKVKYCHLNSHHFFCFFLKREQTAELEAKSLGTPDGQVTNNSRCSAINLLLEM